MVKNLHGTERSIALSKRVKKIIILCHNKEREIKKRRRKGSSSSKERQIYCKSWFLWITIFNNVVHDRRNPVDHACPERNAMWIQQLNKNRIGIWVLRIKIWKIQAFIAKKKEGKNENVSKNPSQIWLVELEADWIWMPVGQQGLLSLPSHSITCRGRMLKIHALLGVNFRIMRWNAREH